ncbi:metallophosphoesterase family protein [Desulfurococcus mucosus]|uniref:Metallophosphoesterase n=1 Tax=Desulfurococcus mucosus (strain ATCC 35584 / DSM 2162 / JCM 9187 / O7/1) TaxID=765177 RepID=E8R848_DESM0|nr:DNA repair exonuclease [Desulfurococcus mucosus]ADV64674.1 metallophosphoesterase [Desulfurococcus mucosus DSM 2162]
MVFIHTGDLHLGCNLSEESALSKLYMDVLDEILENALEHRAPLLISGDFFDHYAVSYTLMIEVARRLRRLREAGVEVVAVQGNHDNARGGRGVLDLYSETGLIKLTRYEEREGYLVLHPLKAGGYVFYGVPGFRNQAESRYIKERRVRFTGVGEAGGAPIIVLAHVSVEFAGFKPSAYSEIYGDMDVLENELWSILPGGTRYVALGHVHIPIPFERKFKSNTAYPGAPIGMGINDLRDTARLSGKGVGRRILLVDVEGDIPSVEALELESAPRVFYEKTGFNSIEELKKYLEQAVKTHGDHHAFIIDVEELKTGEAGGLTPFIQELQQKHGKLVYIRLPGETGFEDFFTGVQPPPQATGLTLEDIEDMVLREQAGRLGLPVEKIREILRLLYEERGEKGRRYYQDLYEELKRALRESYSRGRNSGG